MSYNLMLETEPLMTAVKLLQSTSAYLAYFAGNYNVALAACCPFIFTLILKQTSNKEEVLISFPVAPGENVSIL